MRGLLHSCRAMQEWNLAGAWTNCFGKPLICVIESSKIIKACIYNLDAEHSQPVERVEKFRGGYLIAVAS